jgi:dienelactone hydrolase
MNRPLLAFACFLISHAATAKVVEEERWIDAKAATAYGIEVSRPIMVAFFHDDEAPKPYPALVLNHGRAAAAEDRHALRTAVYAKIARWLAQRGFMVAVPTRIGYGVTGGEDVEDSGACNSKRYPPVYAASAAQTLTVLEYLRSRADVSKDRAVVMGQSFGGATAVAVAAMNVPGVQATINFAGGGGGNPKTRPQDPCDRWQLERLFAGYGKTARTPTLWIYTENDMYFGPKLPKEWFDAFRAAGGRGEYVLYPANGSDGHPLFTRAPEVWQPRVLEFLRANGYPDLK